ncbi:hypothetical protein ACK34I_00040 [Aeromonas veronii]
MKTIYLKEKELANRMQLTDRFISLTNILRSILQTISITTLELAKNETSTDEIDLSGVVERFRRPADGMPVDIIDKLTPHLRSHFEKRLFSGWYEKSNPGLEKPLSILLQEWVTFRNNKPGHGVLDKSSMSIWVDKIELLIDQCLTVFSTVIPTLDNKVILIEIPSGRLKIEFPLVYQGKAIVITREGANKSPNIKMRPCKHLNLIN